MKQILSRGFVRGYCLSVHARPRPRCHRVSGMADGLIPCGEGHHGAFRRLFDASAGMVSICEDLPE